MMSQVAHRLTSKYAAPDTGSIVTDETCSVTSTLSDESSLHVMEAPDSEKSLRTILNLPAQQQKPPTTTTSDFLHRRPLIVGHRGALYRELENTLEGFQYCADLGIDAIELDVFYIHGELIVFHGGGTDENPGDLTNYCLNQKGRSILECTLDEILNSLQFNPDFAEFGCPADKIRAGKIPTLRQVLLLIQAHGRMVCKIELKGEGTTLPVLKLVQEMNIQHLVQFSSFHHDRIALIRQLHPERHEDTGLHVYQTGALFIEPPSDFIDMALSVGASEVHLKYDTCTIDRIDAIHAAGMQSMAWFRGPMGMHDDTTHKYTDVGNETPDMYHTVLQTGVQQLCCNRPDVLLQQFSCS